MPQKPLSVPLFWQNFTTVILCYKTVQINSLTNYKRSKILQQARKQKHIKPLLQKLHWRPVHSRIQYKISNLCHNSFSETYPLYLSELLTVYYPSRQLRSILDMKTIHIPLTKTKTFGEWACSFTGQNNGTHCHIMSVTHHPYFLLRKHWKLIFSNLHLSTHTPLQRVCVCTCVCMCVVRVRAYIFVCVCVYFFFSLSLPVNALVRMEMSICNT